MKRKFNVLFFILITIFCTSLSISAQKKAADYKLTNIKIVPFDSQKGEFLEEIKAGDERSFFNDLAISLFVVVEISGESGSFEVGRKIQITVTEGKKVKANKIEQIGLIGDGGKFYVPLWLYPAMCDTVKITAKISGQKTVSTITRSVPFMCGE